ncbi:MAG: hypothetical protein ABWY05_10750 [Noviherbaspirillum sp.]
MLNRSKGSQKDYFRIPDISVSTTGLPGQVMKATKPYVRRGDVPVLDVNFPKVSHGGREFPSGI